MTTELWALLITNVVAFLAAATAFIKSKMTDNARAQTKIERDKAEQEIRDMVLKHDFAITQIKDNQALMNTVLDDLRDTCGQLNVNIVRLDSTVANLAETMKELKN